MLKFGILARKIYHFRRICLALPLLASGCVADIFGDRAVSYNQEAATNKDKTILTNIIRASLGRPLQFTDLTTVSGTASQSLSLAGAFPFAVHRPPTVGVNDTLSSNISLSGGPTFSVANLSTKEFYSGILNSVSTQQIADYLNEGYPPEVLLPLVISDITFGPKERPLFGIHNSLATFKDFYTGLNRLIAIGLSAEALDKPMAESPILTEKDARDPKLLASLASGAAAGNTALDLKRYKLARPTDPANNDPNLLPAEYDQLKRSGASIYFRLEKKSTRYGFCLDPLKLKKLLAAAGKTLPTKITLLFMPGPGGQGAVPIPDTEVLIDETSLCGTNVRGEAGTEPSKILKGFQNLRFSTRSVAGIISFLGDIVHSNEPLNVFKTPQGGAQTLFNASQQAPPGPSISATVDSHTYYVKVDSSGEDRSSQVLELLAELIALNNSSKDLPAPNVITVISP